ncbi:MAG TPA: asparagine synthase-related protein, partial [Rhodocyclaceae bacterium]|nr:asparagine synthase-related protein [Rhodocyclaceae bacterium]
WRAVRRATVAVERRLKPHKGDRRFPHSLADQMLAMVGPERFRHLVAYIPEAEKARLASAGFRGRAGADSIEVLAEPWRKAEALDILNRWLYVDTVTYLPSDILAKVDIASMATSLECRSPFLDHKVIEFAASLPGRYKLTPRGRSKHILKEAFADWLPPGFMDRNKMGFSAPTPQWLRADLAPMLQETLFGSPVLAEWFDLKTVRGFLDEHMSGRKSHSKRLWLLLCLAIWADRFRVAT